MGGGGGWLESEFSDCLWLSFSLAFAKPNNKNGLSERDTSCGGFLHQPAGARQYQCGQPLGEGTAQEVGRAEKMCLKTYLMKDWFL